MRDYALELFKNQCRKCDSVHWLREKHENYLCNFCFQPTAYPRRGTGFIYPPKEVKKKFKNATVCAECRQVHWLPERTSPYYCYECLSESREIVRGKTVTYLLSHLRRDSVQSKLIHWPRVKQRSTGQRLVSIIKNVPKTRCFAPSSDSPEEYGFDECEYE